MAATEAGGLRAAACSRYNFISVVEIVHLLHLRVATNRLKLLFWIFWTPLFGVTATIERARTGRHSLKDKAPVAGESKVVRCPPTTIFEIHIGIRAVHKAMQGARRGRLVHAISAWAQQAGWADIRRMPLRGFPSSVPWFF